MSNYGADSDPDIRKAIELAYTWGLLPLDKTNVMQWTYPSGVVVRKLAHRKTGSNVLIKFGLTPVPAGDPCTICWGNGKPFGPGETPNKVTIVIEGVEKGPGWTSGMGEPPNGTFILTQHVVSSCLFLFENDDFILRWSTGARQPLFQITQKPSSEISFLTPAIPCRTFYENTITDSFVGGTATIFIPPIA